MDCSLSERLSGIVFMYQYVSLDVHKGRASMSICKMVNFDQYKASGRLVRASFIQSVIALSTKSTQH